MNKNLIPFLDLLFSFLLTLVAILLLVKSSKTDADPALQQNVIYQIVLNWEGDADLDLWMKDSKGHICGFKSREGGEGSLFSLSRDCLGANSTEANEHGEVINKINEEVVSIRGIVEGEYIINVHSYNLKAYPTPLKSTVKLVKTKPFGVPITKMKEFSSTGEEITFFRFSLDKDGKITEINELTTSILQEKIENTNNDPLGTGFPYQP